VDDAAGSGGDFVYTYNGVTRTIALEPGATLDWLKSKINYDTGNPGVRAETVLGNDGK
jgi:hypothetical protein